MVSGLDALVSMVLRTLGGKERRAYDRFCCRRAGETGRVGECDSLDGGKGGGKEGGTYDTGDFVGDEIGGLVLVVV